MLSEVPYLQYFNGVFKFVERKLIIRIVSPTEGDSTFVIDFMFPRLI